MMKLKLPTLALALLLLSLNSKAELTIHIEKKSDYEDSDLYSRVQASASKYWFAEEVFWKVVPQNREIRFDFSLVSNEHLAQTNFERIRLNLFAPKDDIDALVKHEVSHVFLNTYCPLLSDVFIHELFSYWRSGDYLRILYGQNQMYLKSHAIKELRSPSKFDKIKAIATARLISELINSRKSHFLDNFFKLLLRRCNDSDFLDSQGSLKNQFLDELHEADSEPFSKDDSGFLIFDSVANEVLETDGNWFSPQAPGSTLKPFLLSFFSNLKKDKLKRATTEWECGPNIKLKWNYKSALNFSCNGFFLDSKYSLFELDNYVNILNSITDKSYSAKWLSPADLIGLWPSIKLNLLEIARVYDYILERDSETISVLKKTAVLGTLSGSPESKWFVNHNIALKSGTTTRLDLSIDKGFIVAVFNIQNTPKIAVLYRSGSRPLDMLSELKSRIEKYVNYKDSSARVQVLSAFNPSSLAISCPTVLLRNGLPIKSHKIDRHTSKLYSDRYSCVGAPFDVTATDAVIRKLYGDITFQKQEQKTLISAGRSEKNLRAQMGSQIILQTSELHYLKSVFFSEGGNHRQEMKKALLLVIKNNIGFWNKKRGPICDSTICQVFNLNYEMVPLNQKSEITELLLDLGNRQIAGNGWLEFSLGGEQYWQKKVSIQSVSDFLADPAFDLKTGKKSKDEFIFYSDNLEYKRPCELVRSQFKLRSCPKSVVRSIDGDTVFEGQGDGHDRGMNILEANQLAIQGFNFDQILENFYGLKVIQL